MLTQHTHDICKKEGIMKWHQLGKIKDIYWYLKGAIELRAICELEDGHMACFRLAIEEIQETIEREA